MEPSTEFPGPLKQAVWPIVMKTGSRLIGLGTGFIVSSSGLLLTARHVLFEAWKAEQEARRFVGGPDAVQTFGLFSTDNIQREGDEEWYLGGLLRLGPSLLPPQIDMALARVHARDVDGRQIHLPNASLSFDFPAIGDPVIVCGYPRIQTEIGEVRSDGRVILHHAQRAVATVGTVLEVHPVRRDSSLLPFPVMRVKAAIDPGMSGGPVFHGRSGKVIGVVTSGWSDREDGYCSLLYPAADLPVPAMEGTGADSTHPTLFDMAKAGLVSVDDSLSRISITRDPSGETRIEIRHR